MTLTLPEDIEPHLPEGFEWSDPGVYSLYLKKPENVQEAWDNEFDNTPDYVDMLESKPTTVYVGAASNVMRRLEEHRDGDKRKAALLRICEIDGIHTIWWFDHKEQAFLKERTMADMLSQERPDWYVHQR